MGNLLSGVRVIETGSLLCVDLLGGILAALGADVVKVEAPGKGDYLRDMLGQISPHHSPAHLQANAGKRSVALDVRAPAGREAFWRLHETAEVFITGNVSDACDRLGIGYDEQRRRKPSIVFCQYTGFGAHGPYANIPTHGYSMNSLAADWPMARGEDGRLHVERPVGAIPSRGADATNMGATWSALAVLAAVLHVRRGGSGTYIDTSGADAVIFGSSLNAAFDLNRQKVTDEGGIRGSEDVEGWPRDPRHGVFETADSRFVFLSCTSQPRWASFSRAVGRTDLQSDQRNLRDELVLILRNRSQDDWVELGRTHGFGCTPLHRTLFEVRDDPQFAARGMFTDREHPGAGLYTWIGPPVLVDGAPCPRPCHAPALGEHTLEILEELGLPLDVGAGFESGRPA